MRIIQVNTFAAKVGGAEIYMHHLIDELRARGHQVGLFASDPNENRRSQDECVVQRPEWSGESLIGDKALVAAWKDFADEFQPELIHVHNLHTFPVYFVQALAEVGVPILQTVHDFGLLCPNSWCVWPDGRVCEGGAGQKCFEHGCESNYPYDGRVVLSVRLRYEAVRRTIDHFVAPSYFLADKMGEHGFEPSEGLPLWVDETAADKLPDSRPERAPNRVLFVGRLVREKGVEFLVRAWPKVLAKVPNAELWIAGDGPELEPLRELAGKLGLNPEETLRGRVPHEKVGELMATATCLVLPSIWCENSPLTTYESYLMGLPLVASDIAGLPERVVEGELGLLARPRDPDHLAQRIVELLTDTELQKRLQAGCLAAVPKYSKQIHMDKLLGIYDRMTSDESLLTRREPIDVDVLAGANALFQRFGELERWAQEMQKHIHYLEGKPAGAPLATGPGQGGLRGRLKRMLKPR
jgi:glycosyltransferase involved in cell wall biosynthesis